MSTSPGSALDPDLLTSLDHSTTNKYHLKPAIEANLRDYQWELALPGLGELNYIVCAPTGSGKTRVAGLVISEHLKRQKGRGKVLFLVNKVPLVQQQKSALQEMIQGIKIKAITGDVPQHKKAAMNSSLAESSSSSSEDEKSATPKPRFNLENDIIVCTAGCLFNELEHGKLSLSAVSLMVIDECHNTRKSSDYAKIMEVYLRASRNSQKVPQVMGLTATPGAGDASRPTLSSVLDHMISLCAALDAIGGIQIIRKNRSELQRHQPSAIHTRAVMEGRSDDEPFTAIIVQVMSMIERLYGKVFRPPSSSKWSEEYRGWVDTELHKCQDKESSRDKMSILKTLKAFASMLRVYQNLCFDDAMGELDELHFASPDKATPTEDMLAQIVAQLKIKLKSLEKVENPLLLLLEDTLAKKFAATSESKAIVFVEKKSEALSIQQWIASRDKLKAIHSDVVTGQTGETNRRMTKAEQNTSLMGFRGEDCNLLVSTAVLEEGVDVPACNLVITYQKVTSEIAQVQGQGRARASHSQSITIVTSDSGKQFQEMINEEKNCLVEQALEMLPAGESLRSKMKEKQSDILKRSDLRREEDVARKKLYSAAEVDLHCIHCSAFLCNASDVHTIPTTLNHVVSSEDFLSRVLIQDHPRPSHIERGLSRTHKVVCKTCEVHPLGVMGRWWKNSEDYPVIKCPYVRFKVHGEVIRCKKWKNAPFEITPLP